MVEHTLREGTSRSGSTKSLGETEGLSDGEVSLHHDEGSSSNGLLTNDDTSSGGEALVDTADSILGALDLDKEDGLLESGSGNELRSVHNSSGSRDNLTTSSVDSISVESNILNVEPDTSHVLFDEGALLGGPVEGGFHGVLDFIKVLDSLSGIDEHVGASSLRSEAPDLESIIRIPVIFVSEDGSSNLRVLLGRDLTVLNSLGKLIT